MLCVWAPPVAGHDRDPATWCPCSPSVRGLGGSEVPAIVGSRHRQGSGATCRGACALIAAVVGASPPRSWGVALDFLLVVWPGAPFQAGVRAMRVVPGTREAR